ncbi:MAG: DUF4199 domain-containing protein [Calditrichaeota bacterium]|nr:DUF4199 domain-containing protein [Calditrichota bacterium]
MNKNLLKLGGISGAILVLLMYITMPFMGNEISFEIAETLGYLTMILALAPTIYVGIKSQRDSNGSGEITLASGFKNGLFITLVASIIYTTGWMAYLHTADTDFMETFYEQTIEDLKNSDQSEEEIAEQITQMEDFKELYKNPFIQIGVTFLEIFPVGLLISLIAAAILRKQPNLQSS